MLGVLLLYNIISFLRKIMSIVLRNHLIMDWKSIKIMKLTVENGF